MMVARISALGAVPNVHHAVVEAPLSDELEAHPDLGGQVRVAGPHDDRRQEQVVLVDEASPTGM
jgi:hypothetical protein